MNSGFEIEFFDPEKPDKRMLGRLMPNIDGKHFLEFGGGGIAFAFKSFYILYAVARHTDEKYSLVNCRFRSYTSDIIRCEVIELYEGGHVEPSVLEAYSSAEARITHLSSWINNSRFQLQLSSDSNHPATITLKGPFTVTSSISDTCTLEICQFCSNNFTWDQTTLTNKGNIRFNSSLPISRSELYKHVEAFIKLLSLFCQGIPKLTAIDYTYFDERTLKYTLPPDPHLEQYQTDILLRFNELEPHWPELVQRFYANRDKHWQVLELYRESVQNATPEVSFLNLTTALELFHQYFLESGNKDIKDRLTKELFTRKIIDGLRKEWNLAVRYAHLFETVNTITFISQLFPEVDTALQLLRDTRNYYTHYSDPRRPIWTPNQLFEINNKLKQLLKAVILKELHLPNKLINQVVSGISAITYFDYENNPYSISYRK